MKNSFESSETKFVGKCDCVIKKDQRNKGKNGGPANELRSLRSEVSGSKSAKTVTNVDNRNQSQTLRAIHVVHCDESEVYVSSIPWTTTIDTFLVFPINL